MDLNTSLEFPYILLELYLAEAFLDSSYTKPARLQKTATNGKAASINDLVQVKGAFNSITFEDFSKSLLLNKGKSIKQQTAAGFASPIHTSKTRGHVLKIHLKPDDKGVYLGSNSSFDNEKEMLLPRKTVLKIHKTPEVYHDHEPHKEWDNDKQDYVKTGTTKKKVFIWHAHVVHQGDDEHGN
jgi:hypothetical protein